MSAFSSRARRAVALATLAWVAPAGAEEPAAAPSPCPEKGHVVAVVARKRELWLCQDGAPVARFQVAMGRGGVDKRRQGDGRTPLGTYTLGSPRRSALYGVFIPIDYPTPDQAASGFTGSNVGIHGPPRGQTVPEYPTTAVDWTQGCIATGIDEDIGAIAEFVRERQPLLVVRLVAAGRAPGRAPWEWCGAHGDASRPLPPRSEAPLALRPTSRTPGGADPLRRGGSPGRSAARTRR